MSNEKVVVDIIEQEILELSEQALKILLKDRTTKKNIIWATDDYRKYGYSYKAENEIKIPQVTGKCTKIIQPRVTKNKKNQHERTRDKAEVFTPSWICNQQNNLVDEAWFGRKDVFNIEIDTKWKTNTDKIEFPKGKTWKDYINLIRMEITCGEAPYLVSRYDTVSGKKIEVNNRIGLLDRKMRVINENTTEKKEWLKWVKKAYKSIYGFEYQGDNLLLARENLLYTFIENYENKFNEKPEENEIKQIATIISWNLWQMDGIAFTVPNCAKEELHQQLTFFEDVIFENIETNKIYSKIKNWGSIKDNIIEYRKLMGGK